MNLFGQDGGFWATVLGATLIRLVTVESSGSWYARLFRWLVTGLFAIFAATVFTEPVLDILDLPTDTYKLPVAGLLTLTGEGVIRMLMSMTWGNVLDIFRIWRGK